MRNQRPPQDQSDAGLNILMIVDPLHTLNPGHDTSVAIIEAAQRRGHAVYVTTAESLSIEEGAAVALCERIRVEPAVLDKGRWLSRTDWYRVDSEAALRLDSFDAVLMRTDPPFDAAYLSATYVLDLVDSAKTLMLNSPAGLRNANEKLFGLRVPEVGPATLVTSDVGRIVDQVREWGKAVLKPIDAMAGRGILILDPDDANLRSILESSTERGAKRVVVQRWIDEVVAGDRRVIVIDGKPVGAVRRVACGDDFRCNMAAGAVTVADTINDDDRRICSALTPHLREHGLIFAGIDVIGGQLTEINVTSPTGIREIDALSGSDLGGELVSWIEVHSGVGMSLGAQ
ncbi:Glutathione synthetase [Rhodococcus erythropolis]|nr:Glutathione synthetase [Rhodococcus erythropolis]